MFHLIICITLLSATTYSVGGTLTKLPEGITLHKGSVTWYEAHDQCKREGGVIASPIDNVTLNAMKSVISAHSTTYFIGTKATDVPGQYVSIEGIALENMPLTVTLNMIQELNRQDGECMAASPAGIRAVSCWSELPYMCYNATRNITMNKTNCGPDDEGYKYNTQLGKCYKLHTEQLSWYQAHWTCAAEGAHLAIIEDKSKAQIIINMDSNPPENYLFIGRHKVIGKSEWRTIHGQPVQEIYNDILGGRSPTEEDFDCGGLHVSGKWQYLRCHAGLHFFCEKEPTVTE